MLECIVENDEKQEASKDTIRVGVFLLQDIGYNRGVGFSDPGTRIILPSYQSSPFEKAASFIAGDALYGFKPVLHVGVNEEHVVMVYDTDISYIQENMGDSRVIVGYLNCFAKLNNLQGQFNTDLNAVRMVGLFENNERMLRCYKNILQNLHGALESVNHNKSIEIF